MASSQLDEKLGLVEVLTSKIDQLRVAKALNAKIYSDLQVRSKIGIT